MKLRLRTPIPSDFYEISSWVPSKEASTRWAGAQLNHPFAPTELQNFLSVPRSGLEIQSYCLCCEDGSPHGFGQYWSLGANNMHLGRIIVSPMVRGKGVGRQLCLQLMQLAASQMKTSVFTLRVYRDNLSALAL
jgi:ribosomal-protein-alanine N-acetyltransferase